MAWRFRRLERTDRFLLSLVGIWVLIGLAGNYYRVHRPIVWVQNLTFLAWLAIVVCLGAGIVYSIIAKDRSPREYGFFFRRWGWISLAPIVAVYAYLRFQGKLDLSMNWYLVWPVCGAFMEEVGFRAIAINALDKMMEGTRVKAFRVVFGSTLLFCLPHTTSKMPAEFAGIVTGSLILGVIYYTSRSVLLPVWIHAASNTGYAGGQRPGCSLRKRWPGSGSAPMTGDAAGFSWTRRRTAAGAGARWEIAAIAPRPAGTTGAGILPKQPAGGPEIKTRASAGERAYDSNHRATDGSDRG